MEMKEFDPVIMSIANRYLISKNDLQLEKVLRSEGYSESQIISAAGLSWDILFSGIEFHVKKNLNKRKIFKEMKEVPRFKLNRIIASYEKRTGNKIKSGFLWF